MQQVVMDFPGGTLMQKYEVGRLLGQGTFAKVHYARHVITGMSVAIKIIDKEKIMKVGMMDQIKREISVMRLVKHPNIVELYEVMATKSKIYFVIEYVKGGELFNKVAKGKLREDVARKYFQQLISAVDYCHSRGVCHRDIKPENLLLDENENLKISDFGLSALAESKHQDGLLHTTCGTPAYVAPEVINRKGYDGCKADVWSCGVVLYVLLSGFLPFQDSNLTEMYRKIGKAEVRYPSWFPREVKKLLMKILDPNPKTRITIAMIKESSWFRKGLDPELLPSETQVTELATFSDNAGIGVAETKPESTKLSQLNAFDIISQSKGFDLSALFEGKVLKRELRFTSKQPASAIITRLEDIAKQLNLKVKKRAEGVLRLEGSKEGRKGYLSIDAEIFEVTPNFYLVEMKKSNGDTLEFQKMLKHELRPALNNIVWAWQDEEQQLEKQQEVNIV
ncbi:unnamed protein product [Rhodiola kirilowii]